MRLPTVAISAAEISAASMRVAACASRGGSLAPGGSASAAAV
jgi:hypothetical protein